SADRISNSRHDDRNSCCRLLRRQSTRRERRDDYVDRQTNQLRRQFGQPIDIPVRRAKFEGKVLPLGITEPAQSFLEPWAKGPGIRVGKRQRADPSCLCGLRTNRKWPRRCQTGEQRDELAPLQLIELHRLLRESGWVGGYRIGGAG